MPPSRDEPECLVEPDRIGLRVRHKADASEAIALLDREPEHVAQQGLADAQALRPLVNAQPTETKHRQRMTWETSTLAGVQDARAFER